MKKLTTIIVLLIVLTNICPAQWDPAFDHDGDGSIGLGDLAMLAEHWLETKPQDIVDPNGIVWIQIEDDGSGMIDDQGNPVNEGGFTGEMSKYEITNAVFCEYLNAAFYSGAITVEDGVVYGNTGPYNDELLFRTSGNNNYSQITYSDGTFNVRTRPGYDPNDDPVNYDMSEHPVVMVSWYGAMAFCNYYGYDLPTQWQWQAVADFDSTYSYGCGTTISHDIANYWNDNPLKLESHPYTTPVGYHGEFGYGMADMSGNAAEWTSSSGWGDRSVHRGRGWNSGDTYCTVFLISESSKSTTEFSIGFRVCR